MTAGYMNLGRDSMSGRALAGAFEREDSADKPALAQR
jgi:hypothetical protein